MTNIINVKKEYTCRFDSCTLELGCQILKEVNFLMYNANRKQLNKTIMHLSEIGVKISKTKSRLELSKAIKEMKIVPKFPELHT